MNCDRYLGGASPDEYLLKVGNMRLRGRPPGPNKRRMILQAQRSQNDLSLYLEGSAPLPADGNSVNVVSFTVPGGRDVIITSVRNTWSGTGFQNGANLLTWSYILGGGFIMNRGTVGFQNTNSNGWTLVGSGGAFCYENQQLIIQATANAGANAALSGGQIEVQFEGWYIPRA